MLKQYRDMTLEEFVAEFGLMIHDIRALQSALLILTGHKENEVKVLASHGDEILHRAAMYELERLGFIKIEEVH